MFYFDLSTLLLSSLFAHRKLAVPHAELAERIQEALANGDTQRVESILCGTLKQVKEGRGKVPSGVLVCLITVAKSHPKLFTSAPVVQVCSMSLQEYPLVLCLALWRSLIQFVH